MAGLTVGMTRVRNGLGLAGGVAIALMLAACGPSRLEQCRQLGRVTQLVREAVNAAHDAQIGQPVYDPAYDRRLAAAWETGIAQVEAVTLRDLQLQQIQQDLVAAYRYADQLHRQAAELIPENGIMTQDLEVTHRAYRNQAQAPVAAAIADFNRYCIGGV